MTESELVHQKLLTACDILLTRIYKSEEKMQCKAKERDCKDQFALVYEDVVDYVLSVRHMYDLKAKCLR